MCSDCLYYIHAYYFSCSIAILRCKYTLQGDLLMEITCYRDTEVSREHRQLTATVYNLALTQLARSASGNLFIPIRSMQYLAILDKEELVFLDGERKCWIDIAWRNFKPQARLSLEDPVQYEAVYYHPDAALMMSRLQSELPRALQELAKKSRVEGPARVIQFPGSGSIDNKII